MPRLTPATAEKRRMHIVGAAVRCLLARGLADTTVDAVCAEAGISKGAFYAHFDSRDALVHAVMDLRMAEIGPVEGDSPAALADAIFERLIAPTLSAANGRFGLEVMAASTGDEALRRRMNANLAGAHAAIADAIAALAQAGRIGAHVDAGAAALVIRHFMLGAVSASALSGGDRREELRAATRLLVERLLS